MAHHDPGHRRSLLDERCARHQFEAAVDRCRHCGNAFCGQCLVYSFGERQPPFCIPCALSVAGVRSTAARVPAAPRKEMRRREREAQRAREAAMAANEQVPEPEIDWSLPVNGSDPNQDPAYPHFEDEPTSRPQPPASPPPTKPARGGLFGRRKGKVVPF